MRWRAALVAAAIATVAAGVARADTAPPCKGNLKGCGATVVTETPGAFHGAILVPGSAAANEAVARAHGCDECEWTLVLNCDRNTTNDPEWVRCNAARCPRGSLYRLYVQGPDDARPAYVDMICLTATRRIVTAADVALDAERYLTDLSPPPSAIVAQPDGPAVTRLPVFVYARGPASGSRTLDVDTAAGPARLTIDIVPREYRWSFGDGTTCTTASAGGPYDGTATERCDDRVAHAYGAAGARVVRLAVVWGGTFSFDVGYGAVGPRPIAGPGVTAPATSRAVDVRDARAELVGG